MGEAQVRIFLRMGVPSLAIGAHAEGTHRQREDVDLQSVSGIENDLAIGVGTPRESEIGQDTDMGILSDNEFLIVEHWKHHGNSYSGRIIDSMKERG